MTLVFANCGHHKTVEAYCAPCGTAIRQAHNNLNDRIIQLENCISLAINLIEDGAVRTAMARLVKVPERPTEEYLESQQKENQSSQGSTL